MQSGDYPDLRNDSCSFVSVDISSILLSFMEKNHVLTWRNLFSRWGISSVKYQSQFSNFSDRKFSYFHLHSDLLFEIQRQTAKKLWIHIDCCHHFSDRGNDAAVFVRPPWSRRTAAVCLPFERGVLSNIFICRRKQRQTPKHFHRQKEQTPYQLLRERAFIEGSSFCPSGRCPTL